MDSCKKENSVTPPPIIVNTAPIANAGFDKFINSPNIGVELRGNGTDTDGNIVSFSWSKIAGTVGVIILNPGSAVTKIENLQYEVYEFIK